MKRSINMLTLAAILAAGPAYGQEALKGDLREQIAAVQAGIAAKGGQWTAGETAVAGDRDNWQYYVGFNYAPVEAGPVELAAAEGLPAELDWRSANGNFVTRPKAQLKCGSCWAFAMTGGLESYSLLQNNTPGLDLDLSEQVMLSCSGAGSCKGGQLKANFLQTTGLPPEAAYPYAAVNGSCSSAAPGWQGEVYKIGAWGSVKPDLPALKTALLKYGPLPTAMWVYEDFMLYKEGVYSYTTGKKLGGHAVLLVGYNDPGQYFIVKNSWDTGWGEGGFFRVAYSELGSVISFGMSTIAYRSAKGEVPAGEAVLGGAWKRVAPLFEGVSSWQ